MPLFDMHMILTIVAVALVGAIIGLDRTAAGQCMISQPIVAGPLTGWMLGDPSTGLIIGAVLELIWVLDMPVGTFVPADATVSAVSATAIAAMGGTAGAPLPLIGFCILLTVAMVPLTMKADSIVRHWNSRLADAVMAASEKDAGRALVRAHLSGLWAFYLKSVLLYLVFLPLGVAAVFVFNRLPENVHHAMSLYVKLLPLLGIALVVRKLSINTIDLYLLSGFMIAAVAGYFFHAQAPAMLLLVVTGAWLGARYREKHS
jgi:PTS system mannose-specific IIC component